MSDEPSPSSIQLHRPHPLAQLRSSSRRQKTIPSRGDSDETPVSDNKNIQAAFDQLNQRSSTRSPALTESSSLSLSPGSEARSTAEGTTRTGIGTNPSLGSNNNNNNNNMSFTQRRLERGGAVPSSITSLDWNNHRYRGSVDQGLSSSSGSNEYDSSVYYGLSPFVTSSFVDTPLWERSPNGTGSSRYRSLRQRYEREKAEDLDEEVEEEEEEEEENASSPDQSKLPPHQRARFSSRGRQMYEDSDLDMSEDDVDNPARKEAIQNAPFLLRPPSTARYGAKVRSPSPLASSEDLPESVYRSTQISSPLDTRCSPDDLKTNQSNATSQDQSGDIKSIDAQMGRTSLQPTQGAAEEREENEASSSSSSSSSSSRGTTYKKDFAFPDTETSSGQGNEQLRPFDKLKQMLQNKRTTTTTTHDHADDSTGALWRLGSRAFASSTSSDTKAVKSQHQTKLQYAPPRKYILQSPVFQVVNANTIKDCYLFLFSDLLLICIPIMDENIISNSRSAGNKSNGSGSGRGKNSSGSGTGRFRPTENSLFQVKNIVELSKVTLYLSREDQAAQQHRPSVIMGPDGRPSLPPPRKMHPVLATALRKFERKPEDGIAYLIEKQILADEPLNIANFLFKTPDLNRRQLGYFLADPDNRDIYDAFLDCFRLVALRLDEALRILLMTLRLPSNWELLEYVIERFSKKWHDANQNVVKFHEDMVVKVVVAMLFLNAEVWYDASSERDVFWFARENKERRDRQRLTRRASMIDRKSEHGSIAVEPLHYISSLREKGTTRPTWEEFLKRWKHYDQYGLVPVDFLENMYHSIVQEALETGWDNPTGRRGSPTPEEEHGDGDAEQQDIIITVTPHRFPSRLTKNVPSAPITISIPSPDPGLQIKLRGQDLVCKPNVLDFSKSCVQTFTITGHTLGRTSLTFIKSGAHAGRYVSPTLPRTKSIVVERQFMRYTFQIGFSHADMRAVVKSPTVTSPQTPGAASSELIQESGSDQPVQPVQPPAMVKRKYTFSVENEQEKRKWITSLKALCGHVHWSESGKTTTKPEKIMSNEERVALQVLKEELLADEFKKGTANLTVPRTSSGAAGQTLRSSMISVDTSTAISRDNDPLWVLRSPDKEDVTFLDAKESDKDSNKNRKSYIAPSSATTNVVTKRGHEIVKLVVQNSMVPLMLGFLRGQIERPTQ